MSRNAELIKNTLIITIGKICTQFITFLLLPIYTNYLSTSEYGTLDLITSCSSLIAPILSLQMERAVFRFLIDARKNKDYQDKILSTAFSTFIPSFALILIVMPIIGICTNVPNWPLISLLIISSIATNVILQIPRGLGKNVTYSVTSIIIGLLNTVISILTVTVFHTGIIGVLVAHIVANTAGDIYILIRLKVYKQIRITKRDKETLKKLLKFSIPMIPSDIAYWIINVSDRTLIYMFLNDSSNGIYAAATKFPTIIIMAYNMFNLSWMETVSAHVDDRDADKYISETFNTMIKLFSSVCMLAIAIIPFIFNILVGKAFNESYEYIGVLILAAFFNIIVGMLGSVYIGYKKTKKMANTNIAAAIINILINISLIKLIGIWAAVISTVISFMVVGFYRLISIQSTVKIRPNWRILITILAFFSLVIYLYSKNTIYTNVANLILVLIFSIIINWHVIKKIYAIITKSLKNKLGQKR